VVEDVAREVTSQADADPLDRARSLRNRGRRLLAFMLEQQEYLRPIGYLYSPPADVRREAETLFAESLEAYRSQKDPQNPTRHRQALAGEMTTLRELADVRRLDIDRSRPDPTDVERAVKAYLDARSLAIELTQPVNDLTLDFFENWEASWKLGLALTYLIAAERNQSALGKAEALIEESLQYVEDEVAGGSKHERLKVFGLLRRGDLQRARGELDAAARTYLEVANRFDQRLDDQLGRARSLAWAGRALSEAGDRGGAQEKLRVAAQILDDNGAANEAVAARQWITGSAPR
jgi:tetratricopeptide (TPR) repeat protein